MNIFKKSAKFIALYLVFKWLIIGTIGWQVYQTAWFQNYYANDFIWWHSLIIPLIIISILLLIKRIAARRQQ